MASVSKMVWAILIVLAVIVVISILATTFLSASPAG